MLSDSFRQDSWFAGEHTNSKVQNLFDRPSSSYVKQWMCLTFIRSLPLPINMMIDSEKDFIGTSCYRFGFLSKRVINERKVVGDVFFPVFKQEKS